MIHSIRGLSFRFFRANKAIAASGIVTVMLAVSLVVIMASFSVYLKRIAPVDAGRLAENAQSYQSFTVVLSALVIVVTAMMLFSNFQLYLYNNNAQLAIVRALGASAKQVFLVTAFQGVLMTVVGSGLGLSVAGLIYRYVFRLWGGSFAFGAAPMEFPLATATVTACLCCAAIAFGMLWPSYRKLQSLPARIARDNESNDFGHSGKRRGLAYGLLAGGGLLLIAGSRGLDSPLLILVGSLTLLAGLLIMIPLYVTFLMLKAAPIVKLLFGREAYVAVKSVAPQAKNNSYIVLTVSATILIASFGSTFFKTIRANETAYLSEVYASPVVVSVIGRQLSEANPASLREAVAGIPGVKGVGTVSAIGNFRMKSIGADILFRSADLRALAQQRLLPAPGGNAERSIVVTESLAARNGLRIGQTVEVEFREPSGRVSEFAFQVAGFADRLPGGIVEAMVDWTSGLPVAYFGAAYVDTDDAAGVLFRLPGVLGAYPELRGDSYENELKTSERMFYQRWMAFISAMAVIVTSVVAGVFHMLVHHVHARRKEYAILRAISVDRTGIAKMVATQAVVYLLIGIVQGVFMGVILSACLSLIDSGKVAFDFVLASGLGAMMATTAAVLFAAIGFRIGSKPVALELNRHSDR